ncbi:unnamed protein product [Triticum turgidum subsp. durum]|uniref:Uncharacterized protein n=1 Tax=Triticum turgidum subsp. durum TaxID=4567 RepID=A0A9R0TLL0_TRITD|nr:unnamed protein product [Triticum turgidum subsp. durum]
MASAAEEKHKNQEAETGSVIGGRGLDVRKDGVAREVVRMEKEAVIPIIKPKLVMKLADLIGKYPLANTYIVTL